MLAVSTFDAVGGLILGAIGALGLVVNDLFELGAIGTYFDIRRDRRSPTCRSGGRDGLADVRRRSVRRLVVRSRGLRAGGRALRVGWRDLSLDDRRSYTCAEFWVQIACECGWRSQRMPAPLGSSWSPCSVAWPAGQWDEWDEVARGIWRAEHRDQVTARFRHLCRWPGCTRTGHASAPSVVRHERAGAGAVGARSGSR